jgi:hypothetical protein
MATSGLQPTPTHFSNKLPEAHAIQRPTTGHIWILNESKTPDFTKYEYKYKKD